jgi:hypothetical protein
MTFPSSPTEAENVGQNQKGGGISVECAIPDAQHDVTRLLEAWGGIGCTSPNTKLSIRGANDAIQRLESAATAYRERSALHGRIG